MSTATQVKLFWPERNTSNLVLTRGFEFINHFNLERTDKIYYGRFEPSDFILHEDRPLEIVHFKELSFINGCITFLAPNNRLINIRLPTNKGTIKFHIIKPVPALIPDSWNCPIAGINESCFVELYYYPQEGDRTLKYMKSLKCPWSEMATQVKTALNEGNYGHYGKTVGILSRNNVVPDLEIIDSFFGAADSYRKAKAFTILVASSFDQFTLVLGNLVIPTKNVPRIPKDIIHRCRLAAAIRGQGYNRNLLRVLKIAVNGGVPVDLLENAGVTKNDGTVFTSSDFERIFILFGTAPDPPEALKRRLDEIFQDAYKHLRGSSSELALRIIFWDRIIIEMLKSGFEGRRSLPYIFVPEWNTQNLFPHFNLRKVDLAILFRILGVSQEYPMAIFEEARGDFDWEHPHKDFTKLAAMLSSSCIKLAYDMVRVRRKPEEARAFGALIGWGKVQFIIAHPVISQIKVGNRKYFEIHCNISTSRHCIYDVSSTTIPASNVPEDDFCCHAPTSLRRGRSAYKIFEKLVAGSVNIANYECLPEQLIRSVEDIFLPVVEPELELPETVAVNGSLFQNGVNLDVIKKLYFFIECIKERIKFITSDAAKITDVDNRNFFKPEKFGDFGSGKPSAQKDSPLKIASAKAVSDIQLSATKSDLKKRFKKTKSSMLEFDITADLSNLFPLSFPILYDYEFAADDQIIYDFELLEPLIGPNRGISKLIVSPVAGMSLFNCFCFALECLLALDSLHSYLKFVHSDISPNNIMYSEKTGTWKLIDFDQSLAESASLTTSRVAGTEGYIAPESILTGIFTKKSDIYSLGRVLTEIIDSIFINQIHSVESDDEDEETIKEIRSLEPIAMKFSNVINSMIQTDPSARPTALEALQTTFELFKSFFNVPDQLVFDSINMRSKVINENQPAEPEQVQEQSEPSEKDVIIPILSPKRLRISEKEEKEPSTSGKKL